MIKMPSYASCSFVAAAYCTKGHSGIKNKCKNKLQINKKIPIADKAEKAQYQPILIANYRLHSQFDHSTADSVLRKLTGIAPKYSIIFVGTQPTLISMATTSGQRTLTSSTISHMT